MHAAKTIFPAARAYTFILNAVIMSTNAIRWTARAMQAFFAGLEIWFSPCRIEFEIEASCIAVQYRKTIRRPARRAQLILDGDQTHPVMLDGNFDEDWGDCLYLEPVLHHGEYGRHTVEIRVIPDEYEEAEPFYLMALITA